MIGKSTADDLKWFIRLIDKDLRIKVGPKYVLGGSSPYAALFHIDLRQRLPFDLGVAALHPDAFEAYRNSADLKGIVNKVLRHESLQDLSASQILGTVF